MIDLNIACLFRAVATLSLGLVWATQSAHGAEVDVEVRVGGTYSDNARREDLNETSDTIGIAGFWLEVSEATRRFDGSLKANVDYNHYFDDTFDDETFASFDGSAELQLVPRVFSWVITDHFGKLRTDPFQADTPTNRENVNRFSTGPNFRLRLGSATAIELGGQYKKTHYEISDFDNDVLRGSISLIRALSEVRSISLNVSADRIEFDDSDSNSNYDLQSAYLAVQSRISRGELSASIGVNQIHDNGTTFDGFLASISWSREISSSSSVFVDYEQRFSDAGDLFVRFQGDEFQGVEFGNHESLPILGSADPLEISRVLARYRFARQGNRLNLSFSHSQYDYEMDDFLDRDLSEIQFSAQRQLGTAWHAGIGVSADRTEYDQSGREDDDLELSFTIGRQLSRKLTLDLRARRIDRDSNTEGFDYEGNSYSVWLVYTPLAR